MDPNDDRPRLAGPRSRTYRFEFAPRTFLGHVVGFVVGAAALVLAFVFSVVIFAVLAVLAVIAGGWLWWKTRQVRRELREAQSRIRPNEREVRGEAVVVRADEAPGDDPR